VNKVQRATEVKDGLCYLHIMSPCPTGWGVKPDQSIQYARAAVESLYFPLFEYDHGTFTISRPSLRAGKKPRPVSEFIAGQRRFRHLTEEEIQQLQDDVTRKWNLLNKLAS
jgi:pyruvate/2-oxoacid:ferredoxin oxidoreductase beta subunit